MTQQKTVMGIIIGLLALGFLATEAAFIVGPQQQVLITRFGEPIRVIQDPGLHWKTPFIESLVFYDKRILNLEMQPEEVISADKNRLVVDTYTWYRIKDPLLFYQTTGNEEKAGQLLKAQISPGLLKILGKVPFADLLSKKRVEVMKLVQQEVSQSAKPLGIEIVDVRIRRADLPKQNSEAIFKRMNSERERFAKELRAKGREKAQGIRADAEKESTVIIAEAKRDADILRGSGEGLAAEIYAKAFEQDPGFYKFYRSLEAYNKTLADGNTTLILTPDNNEFFHFFKKSQG
jgi:membrane protease subunit HflC